MSTYLEDCQSNVKKDLSSLIEENIPNTHGSLKRRKYVRV